MQGKNRSTDFFFFTNNRKIINPLEPRLNMQIFSAVPTKCTDVFFTYLRTVIISVLSSNCLAFRHSLQSKITKSDVQNMFIRCLSLSVDYLVLETKLGTGISLQICRTGASMMEIGLMTAIIHVQDKQCFYPTFPYFLTDVGETVHRKPPQNVTESL
jgi:hypothetical protein